VYPGVDRLQSMQMGVGHFARFFLEIQLEEKRKRAEL
jgi:hypothetical protein